MRHLWRFINCRKSWQRCQGPMAAILWIVEEYLSLSYSLSFSLRDVITHVALIGNAAPRNGPGAWCTGVQSPRLINNKSVTMTHLCTGMSASTHTWVLPIVLPRLRSPTIGGDEELPVGKMRGLGKVSACVFIRNSCLAQLHYRKLINNHCQWVPGTYASRSIPIPIPVSIRVPS